MDFTRLHKSYGEERAWPEDEAHNLPVGLCLFFFLRPNCVKDRDPRKNWLKRSSSAGYLLRAWVRSSVIQEELQIELLLLPRRRVS